VCGVEGTTQIVNTFGKISSRTFTARLEFQPEYPRRITSAYAISRCKVKLIDHPVCSPKAYKNTSNYFIQLLSEI